MANTSCCQSYRLEEWKFICVGNNIWWEFNFLTKHKKCLPGIFRNMTVTFFSRFMMTCCSDVGDLGDLSLVTFQRRSATLRGLRRPSTSEPTSHDSTKTGAATVYLGFMTLFWRHQRKVCKKDPSLKIAMSLKGHQGKVTKKGHLCQNNKSS